MEATPGEPAPLVLVVEDRASIRYLLRVALGQAGLRVNAVQSAEQALRSAREEPPNIVLLDLLLPTMRGDAFLGALRRLPGASSIPVIVCSGLAGGLAASRAAGAQDFLAKPFDLGDLLACVQRHLDAPVAAPAPRGA